MSFADIIKRLERREREIEKRRLAESILRPKEVANRLGRSVRWVYANADALNGIKVGGQWFFSKEGLEDAFQRPRKERAPQVARPSQVARQEVSQGLSHKKRSCAVGVENSRRIGGDGTCADVDRYGLGKFL
jgi:hypothetical protein